MTRAVRSSSGDEVLKGRRWVWLLGLSLLVFFPDVFFLQKGFLSGDHRLQHYPWFALYAQLIKQGMLPWWTSFNQCGFPLVAEGQVGAFYPFNVLFAFLFPLKFAYNYSVLAHYFLGGIFFFLYCRKIDLGAFASFWGTLIFLYGSAQGGFFYNITSQRTLIWYPLALFLMHRLLERLSWRNALNLGFVFALSSVAGYQQFAVYAIASALLYFVLLALRTLRPRGTLLLKGFALFGVSLIFSIFLASVQWVPFFELSQFSSRAGLTEAFAYMGSMNPLGPLALFFPSWQGILGTELYVGILGIFFVLFSLALKKPFVVKVHLVLFFVTLLLAWGQFSPLYVGFVKLTGFYGFRTPVKFLFFSAFSLAVISAWGVDRIFSASPWDEIQKRLRNSVKYFIGWLGLLTAGAFLGGWLLRVARTPLMTFLEGLVEKFIVGEPYRPHSREVYLEKLTSIYEHALHNVHPLNPWLLATFVFFLLSGAALIFLSRQKQKSPAWLPWLLCGILFCDLYVYGFRNIKGDYENFSFVHRRSAIHDFLKGDSSLFRIYLFNPDLPKEKVPLVSNANILAGIENVGIYSPFTFRKYKKLLGDLGSVDDSLFALPPREEAVYEHLDLLRFLNVKYLLSTKPLYHEALHERIREGRFLLYEVEGSLPRFFFLPGEETERDDLKTILRGSKPFSLESLERNSRGLGLHVTLAEDGALIMSEPNYPGWEASVDGQPRETETVLGLFRKIRVSSGRHRIDMNYRPPYLSWVFGVSGLSLLAYLASLTWGRRSLA